MFNNGSLQEDQHNRNVKSSFLVVVVAFIFLILIGRLFFLQVIMYKENLRLSESNRMRQIVIKANRGNILSRDSSILVRNRVSNHIMIEPYKVNKLRSIHRVEFNADSLEENFKKSDAFAERKEKFDSYLSDWLNETVDSIMIASLDPKAIEHELQSIQSDSAYRKSLMGILDSGSIVPSDSELAKKGAIQRNSSGNREEIIAVQKEDSGYEKRQEIYAHKLKWFVKNAIWDMRMEKEKKKVKDLDLFHNLFVLRNTQGEAIFDSTLVIERLHAASRKNRFKRYLLLEDVDYEAVSLVVEHQENLLGVIVEYEPRRHYSNGSVAAHVLGYTSEITEDELKDSLFSEYKLGDVNGKSGIEKVYEHTFRGADGIKFVEVDVYGRELGMLASMPNEKAKPGYNVISTIDIALQNIAEEAFPDSLKGSLVALNPQNGEILAILSSPSFNPNIYSMETAIRNDAISKLRNEDKPSYNRSVLGTYPPGSLFKLFTSIAGLETKRITRHSKFHKGCNGAFRFGRRVQKCWKASGHGYMNVVDAIRESCDVYFYQLGLDLGMDPINKYARMYGLSRKTNVDISTEKSGLLMDSTTYNKRFANKGWKWTRGQILNLAIGQGELVTPIQMANAFGALATNDSLYTPHLMRSIIDDQGNTLEEYKPKALNAIDISQKTHDIVIEALEQVISAPHGTGGWARVKGVRVGGKTGSAENPHGEKTHAWFAAVAPLEKPTIAIAVLVENAGHGGSVAAPIAGKVLRAYFKNRDEKQKR